MKMMWVASVLLPSAVLGASVTYAGPPVTTTAGSLTMTFAVTAATDARLSQICTEVNHDVVSSGTDYKLDITARAITATVIEWQLQQLFHVGGNYGPWDHIGSYTSPSLSAAGGANFQVCVPICLDVEASSTSIIQLTAHWLGMTMEDTNNVYSPFTTPSDLNNIVFPRQLVSDGAVSVAFVGGSWDDDEPAGCMFGLSQEFEFPSISPRDFQLDYDTATPSSSCPVVAPHDCYPVTKDAADSGTAMTTRVKTTSKAGKKSKADKKSSKSSSVGTSSVAAAAGAGALVSLLGLVACRKCTRSDKLAQRPKLTV